MRRRGLQAPTPLSKVRRWCFAVGHRSRGDVDRVVPHRSNVIFVFGKAESAGNPDVSRGPHAFRLR